MKKALFKIKDRRCATFSCHYSPSSFLNTKRFKKALSTGQIFLQVELSCLSAVNSEQAVLKQAISSPHASSQLNQTIDEFQMFRNGNYNSALKIIKSHDSVKATFENFLPKGMHIYYNVTALHIAAYYGWLDICIDLITRVKFCPHGCSSFKPLFIPLLRVLCGGNFDDKNTDTPPPMFFAALGGHFNVVKYFIESLQCNPHQTSENGETLLHVACLGGNCALVKYLISECHCDVNPSSFRYFLNYYHLNEEFLLIHYACEGGSFSIVNYLLLHFESVRSACPINEVIHLACSKGFIEILQLLLLLAPINENLRTHSGDTLAHTACMYNQAEVMRHFQNQAEFCLNTKNYCDESPIQLACRFSSSDIFQLLLANQQFSFPSAELGSNSLLVHMSLSRTELIDSIRNSDCLEVLHFLLSSRALNSTMREKRIKIIEYLVIVKGIQIDGIPKYLFNSLLFFLYKEGSLGLLIAIALQTELDYNEIVGKNDETPLIIACKHGNTSMVNYLVKSNADVDIMAQDSQNNTALHFACTNNDLEIVEILVSTGKINFLTTNFTGYTPLHLALANQNWRIVKFLLMKDKVYLNAVFQKGENALHIFCKSGNLKIVEVLMSNEGIDTRATDNFGNTPLHSACTAGSYEIVNYLLQLMPKIDVNTKNVNGDTALHICCNNGRFDLVKSLVETGHADVNIQDNLHNTALHIACINDNEEIVDYLLSKNRADVTVMNIKKETPLSITRSKQNPQIFRSVVFSSEIDLMKPIPSYPYETLLEFLCRTGILERMGCENHTCSITAVCEHGSYNMLKLGFFKQAAFHKLCKCIKCDLNNVAYFLNKSPTYFSGFVKNENETLLHIACRLNHLTLVKILVATGLANPESTNEFGNTPLHTACLVDHPLIIKYLVSIKGINLNASNHLQENILHISCKSGSLDTVQSIVQNGNVNFFQIDNKGYTPFHVACESNRTSILDYLCKLKSGCINVISSQSLESPLHVAVKNSCTNVVKYLVETCKINVNLQDSRGQTALHLACEHEVQDIAEIILLNKRTQKPVAQIKDTKGETPLSIACKNKHWKIICYLVSLKEVKLTDKLYDNSNELLLHYLCVHNQVEIIKQADLTSAELKLKDDFGNNPFHLACRSGCFETISYFCLFFELEEDHFVDTNFSGETPLSISCDIDDSNILKSIVSTKALTATVPIGHNRFLLHLLCEGEATEEIKLLDFEHVINLNFVNRNGETALGIAIRQRNKDIIKILASQKLIDLTATDVMGNNLLHLACSSNEKDFIIDIEERIKKKLVKSQNKHNETPLMCACKHKHWTLIEYLISLGEVTLLDRINDQQLLIHFLCLEGKVNFLKNFQLTSKCLTSKDTLDNTPLHLACKSGCIETVKHLLSDISSIQLQSPTDMNVYSETPLSICCQKMLLKVLKLLVISYKITPTTSISPINDTFLLHFLSETGSVDIIKLLDFENEVNIYAVDYKGETAIDIALKHCSEDVLSNNKKDETPVSITYSNKNWKIMEALLSVGKVDPMAPVANGNHLLHVLCENKKNSLINLLDLESIVNVNINNGQGENVLHIACRVGNLEMIKLLLSTDKLDLMASDEPAKNTPLHIACKWGRVEIVDFLLSTGKVDTKKANACLKTPLHLACANYNKEVVKVFITYGQIDLTIKDNYGRTAFDVAKNSYQLVTLFHPFIESQQKFPVEKYCKVFLCGDTTNGKSTLALSIKQRLSGSSFSWVDKVNPFKTQPKAVPLTAGIVPFQLESEEIGNIVLYICLVILSITVVIMLYLKTSY